MTDRKHLTWSEFCSIMSERANKVDAGEMDKSLIGVIVYSEENAKNGNWRPGEYSLEARTYRCSSDNKYFISRMCGNSLYASCSTEPWGVRLDYYPEWIVDYCYIEEESDD